MAITSAEVERRYPIHWLVWNNRDEELKAALAEKRFTAEELEVKDPRGRTPLLLAVTLGYIECVRTLLDGGADVNCEKDGWTAVQEATATGSAALLALVLSRRDCRRNAVRAAGIPHLLRRLSLAPDFYVEMKWEFTSWVPLVSRMCPFDTYKVYKRGANVRVDTTLLGFENNRWQRGNHTYIFRGKGDSATFMELDHETGTFWAEYLEPLERGQPAEPPPAAVAQRLNAPVAINYLDTDNISFERNKCGIWGWRQDKTENVSGYECKVFNANNVELISKTRTEHLPKGARTAARSPAALAGLLSLADSEPTSPLLTPDKEDSPRSSRSQENLSSASDLAPAPDPVTWEQYFSDQPLDHDVGRSRDISTKVQKFKATLWLCENYPLELQEQIMPILDLMASISSPHFAKLKDFVQMQLPAGFPVKIEIPLFHVLNARITFGNIFATETPVPHIECIHEGERLSCVIDDVCFSIGSGYRDMSGRARASDDEERLLQYAIQQSLMEAGTHEDQVDVWEALRGSRPTTPLPARDTSADLLRLEERQLQRAIEASLACLNVTPLEPDVPISEQELALALELSAREQRASETLLADEQRQLDEAMRLSLKEH